MRETLAAVLRHHCGLCYQNTGMALELICETLAHEHGLPAFWSGRSIWIDGVRVASIETSREGPGCVAIYQYWIL